MEKQKAQMRVEERDRRAEELKSQMMNVIPEVEEAEDDTLPFEIPGIDNASVEEESIEETEEETAEEHVQDLEEESVEEKLE